MGIIIQKHSRLKHIPDDKDIIKWIKTTMIKTEEKLNSSEITVRIVNKKESGILNNVYRKKLGPTNVLSFVYTLKPLCGDIVLCAPMISDKKTWAHLVVHGVLHLMGYDHMTQKDAKIMENLEIKVLNSLNFKNPYINHGN